MDPDPGTAAVAVLQERAREAARATETSRTAPATILLVAIWIGLTAGFLDLGLMILKKRLTGDAFLRLGDHFRWIIPVGVGVLVLLPGTALALMAWLRRREGPSGAVVGLLSFVGFLDLCRGCPWSSGRRCCSREGLACKPSGGSARAVGDSSDLCAAPPRGSSGVAAGRSRC